MKERYDRPEDPEKSAQYEYDFGEAHPTPVLARLWIDAHGGAWLESVSGERVVVPAEIRNLVSKRIREAKFR